jgi:hypothetical protein
MGDGTLAAARCKCGSEVHLAPLARGNQLPRAWVANYLTKGRMLLVGRQKYFQVYGQQVGHQTLRPTGWASTYWLGEMGLPWKKIRGLAVIIICWCLVGLYV